MYKVHLSVQINGCCGQDRVIEVEESAMWNGCGSEAQYNYVNSVIAAMHPDWKLEYIASIDRS